MLADRPSGIRPGITTAIPDEVSEGRRRGLDLPVPKELPWINTRDRAPRSGHETGPRPSSPVPCPSRAACPPRQGVLGGQVVEDGSGSPLRLAHIGSQEGKARVGPVGPVSEAWVDPLAGSARQEDVVAGAGHGGGTDVQAQRFLQQPISARRAASPLLEGRCRTASAMVAFREFRPRRGSRAGPDPAWWCLGNPASCWRATRSARDVTRPSRASAPQ